MSRATFADEDRSDRDPLTGADLGDPRVAARVGVALAFALVLARMVTLVVSTTIPDRPIGAWLVEWQVAFASALPLGAALMVMAWRDRPDRALALRGLEALLLAWLAWAVTESWAVFHLQTSFPRTPSTWWWSMTQSVGPRLLDIGGNALGLLCAARQRGRHVVGAAFEVPSALGGALALVLWWPELFSAGRILLGSGLVMLLVPVGERIAQRIATALRSPAP